MIPGATYPIEQPDALAEVASLAVEWFTEHFGSDKLAAIIASNRR